MLLVHLGSLFEFEVRNVDRAVIQRKHKLTTRSRPRTISFPNVVVLVGGVTETASTGVEGFSDIHTWIIRTAIKRHGIWITRGKNAQALIAAEAEFHWHRLARVDRV